MTFNLTQEPWIPILMLDGETRTVSLRECFTEATSIRRIGGELPTQSFALLRLLLAILHDSVGFHTKEDIRKLHRDGIETPRILDYLTQHKHRFDLFHADRPFFQVAGLHTASGKVFALQKLIGDVPDNKPFLTNRGDKALRSIPPAEAAVWLVHCQAFDPSGTKSGAVGDSLAKEGKGYGNGTGWAGQIGGVVLHGPNLARTLVLNIVATPEDDEDRPVWAQSQPHTAERRDDARPRGPVELLTWQSRRIRLIGDRAAVTGVVLAQGDRMTPQNRQNIEAMTAWHYSQKQTKKHGQDVYMPLKHDPNRAGWREVPQFIMERRGLESEKLATLPAKTASQLKAFSTDYLRVGLEIVGMEYGPKESTVADVLHDTLDLRMSLLGQEAAPVVQMMFDAVARTDEAVGALGRLGRNLAKAAGASEDEPRKQLSSVDGAENLARAAGWASIDQPARQWISTLGADTDSIQAHREWQQTTRKILHEQARLLLRNATPSAIQGRAIKSRNSKSNSWFLSAAIAEEYFYGELRNTLPLAYEDGPEGQQA